MKRHAGSIFFLLFFICFIMIHDVDQIRVQAQTEDAVWPVAVPGLLLRGRPLPGQDYPSQATLPLQPVSTPRLTALTPPVGIDLDVTYINRAPMYHSYCVEYPGGIPRLCPGTEHEKRWPDPGEVVTFTAHVVNKGTLAAPPIAYRWFIDEVGVASGVMPGLAPGEEGTAVYQWAWAHIMDGERVVDDHTIRFTIDPANRISETYESNNTLIDRTNALGFRIAITPAMIAAYNTPWNPAFSFSAEDWLQRQIAAMNWSLENAVYPVTPAGATERVRINWIEIREISPINDGTTDGGWFVDDDYRLYSGGYDPVTDIDWYLVHELSHQVGLIDLYQSNVPAFSVTVLDSLGNPVNFAFTWPNGGIMAGGDIAPHTDPHLYSSHSAGGISSTKGYRRGYYGEYQYDIPEENTLLILDNTGQPAADVSVALYQRTGPADWTGHFSIDNDPEFVGTTDGNGRVVLTNQSAEGGTTTNTGHTLRDNPFGVIDVVGRQNRFLVRVSKGNHEEFGWLDVTAFNLAYWQGETHSHTLTIPTHVPPPQAPPNPQISSAQIEGNQVILCWSDGASQQASAYRVYRAAEPIYAYELIAEQTTNTCITDDFSNGNRIYAVTALDGEGRESGFSWPLWVPRLVTPNNVAVTPDGRNIILDPWAFQFLTQTADGRYLQPIGAFPFGIHFSRFLTVDQQNRIIFSHPGDYYNDRHSVIVINQDRTQVIEFGSRGSSPGQFETPTGVAVWGQPSTIEGPHPVDDHTLLLAHFDGSYSGAQGETGAANGTEFTTGRYDQGVEINDNDTLTYATAGNLNRTAGSIEFWLRPNWDGDDFLNYTFFEVGNGWFNRMRITKDGANNLRFIVWNSTAENGVATNVAHWRVGEWHHVAVTWQETTIALYVDGLLMDSLENAFIADALADTIHIGSTLWLDHQANAVIDEFRISDIPRLGNSDSSNYRILVADSGNHRIQAFNEAGDFISAFGSFGSGPGQFNNPQGIALDSDGRLLVVDQNNNRLQLLRFDGTQFYYVRTITADFYHPTSVSFFADQRMVVADTLNHMVKIVDINGNLLATYTAPNDVYTGQFNNPQGVAVDKNQNIVVADTENRRVVTIEVEAATGGDVIYVSVNSGGIVGGVSFADEDILAFDTTNGTWSLFFDGSDVGLSAVDVDGVNVMADGTLLLSLAQHTLIPGLGMVANADIVRFLPTSLGAVTAGTFEWFFDGSDVGLTRQGEDVDAFGFAPDGRLLLSTRATFRVPRMGGGQLLGADEDLIVFNGVTGSNTMGRWEMYFDGSDALLYGEDIWGVWVDPITNDIYLSLQDAFQVNEVQGDALDIFICHPVSLGENSACTYDPGLYFDGSAMGLRGGRIDGFSIGK